MNDKTISPEMAINKGKKWITVEKIQFSYGIIECSPIEPIENFNFDHISKDFTKAFSEIVSDVNSQLYDDLFNNDEMYIVKETHNISLIENQIFGIEFGIITEKATEEGFMRELAYQIKYPDKQNEGSFITTETIFDYEINTYQFIWQKLDTDTEMVAGEWTFTLIDNHTDNTLLTEKFNVFYELDS
jgi:hypothetical protein